MNSKSDRKAEAGPIQQPIPPAWYGNPAAMSMYNMYNPYMYPPGYGAPSYYPYYQQPSMQPFMGAQNAQQDGANVGAVPFRAFTPGGHLSSFQPSSPQLNQPPPNQSPSSTAIKINESTDDLPPLPPGPPPNQPTANETAQSENHGVIQSGPVKFAMFGGQKLDFQPANTFNQQSQVGMSKASKKRKKKKNQQLARKQEQMMQYQKQYQWPQKQAMNLLPDSAPPLPDNQLPPLPPGSPPPPPPPPSTAAEQPLNGQIQPLMNVDTRPSVSFNLMKLGFQQGSGSNVGSETSAFQTPPPQLPSMAQVQAQGIKALDEWPAPLRDYVARCYAKCVTQIDKDRVGVILKGKLIRATSDGTLWTKDWNAEPLPLLDSDSKAVMNLKEKLNRSSVTSRLGPKTMAPQQPRKRFSLPTKSSGRSAYRSPSSSSRSSRSRSSSSSGRSRSRSPRPKKNRTPNKKNDRNNRNRNRHLDSNKSHFYSEFGVIGGSDDLDVRKEVLDKRAARFNTSASKSTPKTNQVTSVASRLGNKDGVRKKNLFNFDYGFSDNNEGSAAAGNGDYEVSDLHIVGTCEDLEKAYLRLTAAPEATQVRPRNVLIKSLNMVKAKWSKDRDYRYAFEQLKSIRQDLTVQGIRDELSVEVYETHARIALEMKDVAEFNQCQSQLRILHDEVSQSAQNKLEFKAYAILYFILTKDFTELSKLLSSLSCDDKKDECVSHAVEVARAWLVGLYVRVFKLYKKAPRMSAYLIDMFINRERIAYFKVLMKAYRPSIPLDFVKSELELDTDSDVEEFLTSVGNVSFVASSPTLIDCKAFQG